MRKKYQEIAKIMNFQKCEDHESVLQVFLFIFLGIFEKVIENQTFQNILCLWTKDETTYRSKFLILSIDYIVQTFRTKKKIFWIFGWIGICLPKYAWRIQNFLEKFTISEYQNFTQSASRHVWYNYIKQSQNLNEKNTKKSD